jgi:hypothetical protein
MEALSREEKHELRNGLHVLEYEVIENTLADYAFMSGLSGTASVLWHSNGQKLVDV